MIDDKEKSLEGLNVSLPLLGSEIPIKDGWCKWSYTSIIKVKDGKIVFVDFSNMIISPLGGE